MKNCLLMRRPVALFFLSTGLSLGAFAFSADNGDGVKLSYSIDSSRANTVLVEGVQSGYTGSLVIPETITYDDVEYTVAGIDDYALMSASITSVEIPESVTSIGAGAFNGCKGLTSLVIPDGVVTIGSTAFGGCSNLVSVVIGNDVTTLEYGAFSMCYDLRSVVIGESVTSIGAGAFDSDTSLESITARPTTPPTCGDGAFMAVPHTCVVVPPAESADLYQSTSPWSEFSYVVSGVRSAVIDVPSVTVTDNEIHVTGDNAAAISVYDVSGHLIGKTRGQSLTVPAPGVYLISVNGNVTKVVI